MRKFTKSVTALAVVMMLVMALFAPAMATSEGVGTPVTPTASSTATVNVATANEGDILHMFKVVDATFNPTANTLVLEFTNLFKAFMTAKDLTLTEEEYAALEEDSDALNDVLGKFTAYVKEVSATEDYEELVTGGTATFTNVAMGQYIIVGAGNTKGALVYATATAEVIPHIVNKEYKIYTAYDVEMKTTEPKVDKTIEEGTVTDTSDEDKETASIGDTVSYGLKITVPTYPAHATNTTFYVGDVMSAGLKFVKGSIVVRDANGDVLVNGTDYTVSSNDSKFFIDFIYDQIKTNGFVTVEYDAEITDDAVIGGTGNDNKVTLVYSNNPFDGSTFDPYKDEPYDPEDPKDPDDPDDPNEPDRPTEEDPGYGNNKDEEVVYTYGIIIDKFDKKNEDLKLAGATFEIYDNEECEGDPVGTATTDLNGVARYKGLKAGTYWIKETVAPTGYNLLPAPAKVTIDASTAQAISTTTTVTLYAAIDAGQTQATKDGELVWINEAGDLAYGDDAPDGYAPAYVTTTEEHESFEDEEGTGAGYVVEGVANDKGFTLPGTGGIGTKIFYVVGGLLMAGAVIFLITKRRMRTQLEK